MSWKRALAEGAVHVTAMCSRSSERPAHPKRIFVLRNNDLGDLLVVTPLFEALRRRFPEAEIVAGIGPWSQAILENNPFVDDVFSVTAPWHNKAISPQSDWRRLSYCLFSHEVKALREKKCDIGIDILGSPFGSLMMMQAGIPYRLGVRGYAGGHSACHRWVESDGGRYVGRHALVFAELLGVSAKTLPPVKPQLYMTGAEIVRGESMWSSRDESVRLVVGFGGGFPEKCWPLDHFRKFLELMQKSGRHSVKLVGGPGDQATGDALAAGLPQVENLAGRISLRETFALTSTAHQVLTNPSMLMHVAAAFSLPTVVSMGPFFPSVREHNALWICSPQTTVLGCEVADGFTDVAPVGRVYEHLLSTEPASLSSRV